MNTCDMHILIEKELVDQFKIKLSVISSFMKKCLIYTKSQLYWFTISIFVTYGAPSTTSFTHLQDLTDSYLLKK